MAMGFSSDVGRNPIGSHVGESLSGAVFCPLRTRCTRRPGASTPNYTARLPTTPGSSRCGWNHGIHERLHVLRTPESMKMPPPTPKFLSMIDFLEVGEG